MRGLVHLVVAVLVAVDGAASPAGARGVVLWISRERREAAERALFLASAGVTRPFAESRWDAYSPDHPFRRHLRRTVTEILGALGFEVEPVEGLGGSSR